MEGKNGARVGCGNIISKLDGTADEKGSATNKKSTYQNDYPAAAVAPPVTAVNIASGTAVNTKGIQEASLIVPPKIPAASDEPDIMLVQSNGKPAVVPTSYNVEGTALPAQPVKGAAFTAAEVSVTLGVLTIFGAVNLIALM